METIYVISKTGKKLMPSIRPGRIRHLLKDGKAIIVGRNPFTVKLLYDTDEVIQPIELSVDAGYRHIGISAKTQKKELFSAQYDLLPDEKEKHDSCRRYRRTRRNRLRYRKKRFDNRKRSDGWLAPSIQNKANCHISLIESICKVAPVTQIYVEVGEFDPALLKALNLGLPIPEGTDYQNGPCKDQTLRKVVF